MNDAEVVEPRDVEPVADALGELVDRLGVTGRDRGPCAERRGVDRTRAAGRAARLGTAAVGARGRPG
jgi:hypothetical protein